MKINFIWPPDLNDLSNDELLQLLTETRTRREKVNAYVKNARKVADKLSVGAVKTHIEKELVKFTKAMEKADRAIIEIEQRLTNVMALRLQLEDGNAETQ